MNTKSQKEIEIMQECGKKLGQIKSQLFDMVEVGVSAYEIEEKAQQLIKKSGGKPSFMMVDGYSWATCVNINEGVVHGIPKKSMVFAENDVVSVDVGLFFKGYHTDTSFSKYLGNDAKIAEFLKIGKRSLDKAISKMKPGNKISDISYEMQNGVESNGYSVLRALVGHGIGKELHEDPQIPCFVTKSGDEVIKEGAVFAIEIMYTMGKSDIELAEDGWTISMRDGKISALYEETVVATKNGPIVLTA